MPAEVRRRGNAVIEPVLAQPAVSSQLIDNLNASMHLRAVLTDLFLLSDIARIARRFPAASAVAGWPNG